jgi:hypothetical protein
MQEFSRAIPRIHEQFRVPFKKFQEFLEMKIRVGKTYLHFSSIFCFVFHVESAQKVTMVEICILTKDQRNLIPFVSKKFQLKRIQVLYLNSFSDVCIAKELLEDLEDFAEEIGGLYMFLIKAVIPMMTATKTVKIFFSNLSKIFWSNH